LSLGCALFEIVQEFQEFSRVLLAVTVTVGLIEELQGLDKDLQTFLIDMFNVNSYLNYGALHNFVTEELFEDFNRCYAEVSVAERNKEVVLQT